MWRLFLTEMRYQLYTPLWLIFVALVVVLISSILQSQTTANFVLAYSAFIAPYFIFINATKENRNRLYAGLPFALRHIATYRLILIFFFMAVFGILYWLLNSIVFKTPMVAAHRLFFVAGMILMIYGISYIYRDMFREFILRKGITREKVAPVLILIGIILQVTFLFLFLQPKSGNNSAFNIGHVFHWLEVNFPFRGEAGHFRALITGSILAVMSIFTFERSKVRY